MLTDTHCHLNFNTLYEDLPAVIQRFREQGLVRILVPGTDLESSRLALQIAEEVPEVYAAVGFHPTDASAWDSNSYEALKQLARHPRVRAIGEIGLDYYWDRAPKDVQQSVFREQLRLAQELNLPVVIHSRDAEADTCDLLFDWKHELIASGSSLAAAPGVLHSYSGDFPLALAAVRQGFMIGVTGPVTYKKAEARQALVAGLPIDSLLIETDAPFLPPHPHRGERNEPAYVRFIAIKIAELHRIAPTEVARITRQNAERLFKWE